MMRKNILFISVVMLMLSIFVSSNVFAETKDYSSLNEENLERGSKIDIANGWTIIEYESSLGIDVKDVFKQGVIQSDGTQEYTLQNFANIGNTSFTAQKEIAMKKNGVYTLNIIYAMQFPDTKAEAYIDFNGHTILNDNNPEDKLYIDIIEPTQDMTYRITQHYKIPSKSVGYMKLGNYLTTPGIIEEIPAGEVTVIYKDEEGKEIHESQVINGNLGDSYDASIDQYRLTIEGYTLDTTKLPSNGKGTLSDQKQTVTYIYIKDTTIPTESTSAIESTSSTSVMETKSISSSSVIDATSIIESTGYTSLPKKKSTFPKTGEKKMILGSLVGIIIICTVGYLIYARKK